MGGLGVKRSISRRPRSINMSGLLNSMFDVGSSMSEVHWFSYEIKDTRQVPGLGRNGYT